VACPLSDEYGDLIAYFSREDSGLSFRERRPVSMNILTAFENLVGPAR
jgi:hypothetical protein